MAPKSPTPSTTTPAAGRRIQVRRSGVHGKGVFALVDIPRGTRIIEYVGEIVSWEEAQRRHPHDPSDPNHTFYFHIDEDRVIDALHGRPWRVARPDLDDWRAMTAQIEERLRPGDVLVLDQKVAPAVFLFSDHPTQIATERDQDTERELQLAKPRYTWAIFSPGVQGVANPAIQGMVATPRNDGMRWVKVNLSTGPRRTFAGMPEVWHLETDAAASLRSPAASAGVEPSVTTTRSTATSAATTTTPTGTASQGAAEQENDD